MPPQKFPPLLPKNYLTAIGSLSTYYAYLESVLEISIWAFLDLPREDGALVTTHLGMVSKQQILNGLMMKRFEKEPAKLEVFSEILEKVEEIRIERNKIIHDLYKHSKRGPIPKLKITARKGLKENFSRITLEEIEQVTSDTWSTISDLMDVIEIELPDYPPPWRRQSSPPNKE